ncbi:MAG: adenylate/guanylate cyclase domain-containing protein [Pseudomonadota bacterium]
MHILVRGRIDQWLRLVTGLILFAFVTTHFANHALGLISIDAMEWGQTLRWKVTRSMAGKIILASALFTHIALAIVRIAQRGTLRLPAWEAVQIVSGLTIPLLLIPHIVGIRLAEELFALKAFYFYAVLAIWVNAPLTTAALMMVTWIHACIGLHFWLRLSPTYLRALPVLFAGAVALPILSYTGFTVAGRQAAQQAAAPGAEARIARRFNVPDAAERAQLDQIEQFLLAGFWAVIGALVLLFVVRALRRQFGTRFDLAYVYGPNIRPQAGPTLLEISRRFGIPHRSVCGGRARCSTCRVRVERGAELLEPPARAERRTLASIGAAENVRLACQMRPREALTVFRLVAPRERDDDARVSVEQVTTEEAGVERELVIFFLDVRGFTRWSEGKLPYDVVFILNEFFAAASQAVTANGGWIDKYMGDGMMAVFGRTVPPAVAARQAFAAVVEIERTLAQVSTRLEDEVGERIRVGIGLHLGNVVLGRVGYADASALTVIGEAVNTASRLEGLTGTRDLLIAASQTVVDAAGLDVTADLSEPVALKGLDKPIDVVGFRTTQGWPNIQTSQDVAQSAHV